MERQAQVHTADDGPVAYAIGAEPALREGRDPPLDVALRGAHSDGIPHEGRNVELGLTDHRLGIDHDPSPTVTKEVVVMEVAVHQGAIADVEARVDILGERHEVVLAGHPEPARDVIADPPEWSIALRRPPESLRRRDRHAHCSRFGHYGQIACGLYALE